MSTPPRPQARATNDDHSEGRGDVGSLAEARRVESGSDPFETASWSGSPAPNRDGHGGQETWLIDGGGSATTVAGESLDAEAGFAARALAAVAPKGLLGHYRLIRPLGRGAMGIVFLAHDPTLDRAVALKVLAPERAADPQAQQRFVREAQAAAAIHHEHVVPVYAVSQVGGLPFLVMKYVEGRSLEDKLRHEGPLSPAEVVRIGIQAASGLAAAHARGLVHRDVKPSNILLDGPTEEVRISDFGLARAVDDAGLTLAGVVAGTPLYMAPEQARGDPVDHRADLYSLGSVLYALCVGHPPFQGGSSSLVMRRVGDEPPPAVHSVRPAVPSLLSDLIARLHALDPADRCQSAAEVADRLRAIAAAPATPEAAAPPFPAPKRRRVRRGLLAAGIPALMLGATLGLTEAAGVTRVASLVRTVLNIQTAGGTLMVEVDDPGISVAIEDGGDQLVIKGKAFQELRLRPGPHAVRATRDGVVVGEELVTINQGGKQVVRITQTGAFVSPQTTARPRATLFGHSAGVTAVAFAPDGTHLATAAGDGTAKVWDVRTNKLAANLTGHADMVFGVAYSPDGRTIATASRDRSVRCWDARDGRQLGNLEGHTSWVWCVLFSPDGKLLASGSTDATIRLWDVDRRVEVATLPAKAIVRGLAFSPDGARLAAAYASLPQRNLVIWDVATRQVEHILDGHPTGTNCIGFSPDGAMLASGGDDNRVRLWDVGTWAARATYPAQDMPVCGLVYLRDRQTLASAGADFRQWDRPGKVVLWDLATGRARGAFDGHAGGVNGVATTADGRLLASCSTDATTKLWDLPPAPGAGEGAPPR